MKTSTMILGLTATLTSTVLAHPALLQERQRVNGQSVYTDPPNTQRIKDIKAKLVAGGANSLDMAIAMHEQGMGFQSPPRDCDTSQCVDGVPSCIDNYGIFNNNWWQITLSCDGFQGLGSCDIAKGNSLFTNYTQMVQCQHQQMAMPQFHTGTNDTSSPYGNGTGLESWFVSQNYGAGGWTTWNDGGRPHTIQWKPDIQINQNYEFNVLSIKYWIDNGNHMADEWLMSSNIPDLTAPATTCIYPKCGTPFVVGH